MQTRVGNYVFIQSWSKARQEDIRIPIAENDDDKSLLLKMIAAGKKLKFIAPGEPKNLTFVYCATLPSISLSDKIASVRLVAFKARQTNFIWTERRAINLLLRNAMAARGLLLSVDRNSDIKTHIASYEDHISQCIKSLNTLIIEINKVQREQKA